MAKQGRGLAYHRCHIWLERNRPAMSDFQTRNPHAKGVSERSRQLVEAERLNFGLLKAKIQVPDDFDARDPDIEQAFEGDDAKSD